MTTPESDMAADVQADAEWDTGDRGCGKLVLQLRFRLQAMARAGFCD